MTNEQLKQSAKDEAAMEAGYLSFEDFKFKNRAMGAVTKKDADLDYIINRAMEIYAERVNGWVNVSEKMPELNQFVLADYGYKIPIIFCYKGDSNWLALDAEIWVTDDGIKQWMPLPNKPIKTTKP